MSTPDKPFIFTPGECITRDGDKVVLLITDAPGKQPLIGHTHSGMAVQWCANGKFMADGSESCLDLMPPVSAPERVVRWVTLERDGRVTLTSGTGWLDGVVCRRRVILTPGQYDTEDTPSEWDQAIDAAEAAIYALWFEEQKSLSKVDCSPFDMANVRWAIRALKRGAGHA